MRSEVQDTAPFQGEKESGIFLFQASDLRATRTLREQEEVLIFNF